MSISRPTFTVLDREHEQPGIATCHSTTTSAPSSVTSNEDAYGSSSPTEVPDSPADTTSSQSPGVESNLPHEDARAPKDSQTTFSPSLITDNPSRRPLSHINTFGTLSPTSTAKPSVTPASTIRKSATTRVTTVESKASPKKPKTSFERIKDAIKNSYYDHWMEITMIGLAVVGLLTAMAHHLYNASLDGHRVNGDTQWPPRYGNALSFFVKTILIASVQIAYKQQAWLVVKKRALKVATLDAIFSVNYDPFQFGSYEFLTKTWIPALLALISWALPLCAIASPSTLTSVAGSDQANSSCPNIPVMNFSREIDYTLGGATDALSGLANWDIRADGKYYYDRPSPQLQRIFTLATLTTTGPIQPSNPCPGGTNCTYVVSFDAPAYGCEERDEFGGPYQQVSKSDLAPTGNLLYTSYSSYPMGLEDEYGTPISWENMSLSDPMLGVFTGLPSLWLGWCTADSVPNSLWANLTPHIAECQMYDATYTFEFVFENGQMSINGSSTKLNNLLLPSGSVMSPNTTEYLQFGSYHATGFLLRDLLSGNATLANASDPATEYVITWTTATQTTLLNSSTQLPTGGDDLATSVSNYYRDIFLSMMSDESLHDRQLSTIPCLVTSAVQEWKYEPFWLIMPYCVAVGITFLILFIGMHGFISNGYAADASFSTFVTTSRSKDLDELSKGSCLGHWPKEKHLLQSRLRFGDIDTDGPNAHAAFAFPENVKDFDKRKQYVQKTERA